MRWRDSSIARRLAVVTLGVGLIAAMIETTVLQLREQQDLLEAASARDLARAERTSLRIDDRIEGLREQLRLVAISPAISTLDRSAADELADALHIASGLDRLVLYDRDGRAVAGASETGPLQAGELRGRDDLDRHASGPARWSTAGGAPAAELLVLVEDPSGTTVGHLAARAPIEVVIRDATARLTSDAGTVLVTDPVGTVMSRRPGDPFGGRQTLDVDVLVDGSTTQMTTGDETLLVTGSTIANLPGWVAVVQPRSDVVRPAGLPLGGFTGVFLLVIFAVVGAVLVAGRQLLRPLGPLSTAVERLGSGDLDVRVDESASGEVGVLQGGFNRMARALQERQRALLAAEREARSSEERLRLMIDDVTEYAIFMVDVDGHIRSWNAGASRLLAYESDEALERRLDQIYVVDGGGSDVLSEAAARGRTRSEGWCRRRDGERFWARIAVTALHDDGLLEGAHYGHVVILHDLTDRAMVQAALRQALEREKLAASELRRGADLKDEFLAIAAHEIRTPLSAILGATEVLIEGADEFSREEQQRFHTVIATYAHDMRDIVERLLDFTRLQAGRVRFVPERIQLREAFDDYLRPLARQLERHRVVRAVPATSVVTDPTLLRHVTTNLVSNAAKFSPAGSAITITVEVGHDQLEMTVRDHGCGIPFEDRDRIFELFRRSSHGPDAAGGTGVGLAIVKRYVDLAGGDIRLRSDPGRGSTFTIRIPVTFDGPVVETARTR